MSKEEIQALIDAKIAGQGNQIDSGGALAKILTEILALASSQTFPRVRIGNKVYTLDEIEVPEHGAEFFVPNASEASGVASLVGYEEKP